jgi:hypothetical protein
MELAQKCSYAISELCQLRHSQITRVAFESGNLSSLLSMRYILSAEVVQLATDEYRHPDITITEVVVEAAAGN